MAIRVSVRCDDPDCAEVLEGPWCPWGEGLGTFALTLSRGGWSVDDAGNLYCRWHTRERRAARTASPPPAP